MSEAGEPTEGGAEDFPVWLTIHLEGGTVIGPLPTTLSEANDLRAMRWPLPDAEDKPDPSQVVDLSSEPGRLRWCASFVLGKVVGLQVVEITRETGGEHGEAMVSHG